jgi:hypothetical protein
MSNPYESPYYEPEKVADPSRTLPQPQQPGLVGQVRIVAVLMIVQGVLELITGAFLIVMSFLAGTVMKDVFANNPNIPPEGKGPSPEVMSNILFGTYAIMGISGLLLGVLHVFAGYRNFDFRGRALGIVGATAGLAAAVTCYCLPTGLALCIYGLIVYLNQSVEMAFRTRSEGYPSEAILVTFSRYHFEQSGRSAT